MVRQPAHIRNGNLIGDLNNLNQKAVKILSVVKFSPISMSREDITDVTAFSKDDVERQVKLLLQYNLIKLHAQFPIFPNQGWKVFTEREKHIQIIKILKHYGIEDPRVSETRNLLGNYYPTGLDLEGDGKQQNRGFGYIQGHPIIPELEFRPEAIKVMEEFRDRIKPFKPKDWSLEAVEEKKGKWTWFVQKMSEAYRMEMPRVEFGIFSKDSWSRTGSSARDDDGQSSYYRPSTHTLYFTGRFSLTTLLHEFGHARGFDERDTIIWSINFGSRIFPVTFNRLLGSSKDGTHMLVQNDNNNEGFEL